ncbi:hypothetical protein BD408DRAFT_486011 [Parasitella parasitica]|nr:hypothetical protein BD408DRAFT_486011 [Parasitella parasitica]
MENQWTISIPAEPTARLVFARNISLETQEATIKDFFSFCGIISAFEMKKDVEDEKHQIALILFEKEAAAKTATLLSQAVVDDSPIDVKPYFKQTPVAGGVMATGSANAEQQQQQQQQRKQSQESKSASHVMAELLASGYVLTESVVMKGVEFDEKHGVSSRVNGYLTKMGVSYTQLNQKIRGASSEKNVAADTAVSPPEDTVDTSLSSAPASSRMQSLKNSRAGLRVQGLASRVAGKVSSVHEEAKRIATEKKKDAASITLVNGAADHKPGQQKPPLNL